MKKIVCFLLSFLIMTSASFAQSKNETGKKASDAKEAPKKVSAHQGKMKQDGTPDMRYKGNKDAAKTKKEQPKLKKDGTPDMRYKSNKKAAPKKEEVKK